ncbi:MAG: hypothetical protein WAK20_21635 [Candidatus Acidiferrum sp.]
MTQLRSKPEEGKKTQLSVDTWAVLVALLAAILIRTGIIARVPW